MNKFSPRRLLEVSKGYTILKSTSDGFSHIEKISILHLRVKRATKNEQGWWCLVVESLEPPVTSSNGRVISFPEDEIYILKPIGEINRNISEEIFGY